MKFMEVLNVIVYALVLLLGWAALWYKSNAKLSARVTALIAAAETEFRSWTKAGGTKREWVVDQLYSFIPAPVRPFIPRSIVTALVQTAFDAVQGYAKQQLDKLAEHVPEA